VIMRKYEPSRGNRLGDWTADNSIQIDGIVKLVDITLPPCDSLKAKQML
jgi:hypothetical protein